MQKVCLGVGNRGSGHEALVTKYLFSIGKIVFHCFPLTLENVDHDVSDE